MTRTALVLAVLFSPALALAQTNPVLPTIVVPTLPSPGTDNAANAPRRSPGLALTITGGARIGAIQGDGGPVGVIGPLGGIDLMIGHQLAILDDVAQGSISLVYHGSIFGGIESPVGRSTMMIEHRHGLGIQMRGNGLLPALTTGAVFAHLPQLGTTVPGWYLTAHLAFAAGAFVFSIPLSVEVYVGSRATIVSESIGLSIGATTN